MDQVVAFIAGHEIACTGEFYKHKDISEGVLEYSDKINADLIIIMTQKESDWTVFVSTESQQIINNSEVPICSIRPIERKDTTEYVIT